MKKIIFALTMLTCLTTAVFSQSAANGKVDQSFLNDYVCRNWTSADGLPGMTITAIMQDQKGYIYIVNKPLIPTCVDIYIGTYDGLARFDGVEFVNFTRNIDSKYDFASVRSIFQDTKGNLWVGHNDEGVSCIQPDGQIIKYTTADGLPHNSIRAITEDFNNNIWLGTASGLCYMTPERKVKIPDGLHELGQDTIQVSRLYCDTAGRIWISTAIENDLFIFSN